MRQEEEGESIQTQREDIARHAAAHNLDIVGWYHDTGRGGRDEREEYQRLLADLEGGDTILVWKLDRLGRRFAELARIIDDFERRGVTLVFVTQPGLNRLAVQLHIMMADNERQVLRERVLPNLTRMVRAGQWVSRVPTGYRVGEGRRLEIDEAGAERVRAVFAHFLAHRNERTIAREFGMGRTYVRWMLRNPVYRGILVWGDETIPDAHPAIIAADVFDAAQEIIAEHRERGSHWRPDAALLSGLVVAAETNERMHYARYQMKGIWYTYYRSEVLRGRMASIRADQLENDVTTFVRALDVAPADYRRLRREIERGGSDPHARERARIAARLATISKARGELTVLLATEAISHAAYSEAVAHLNADEASETERKRALPPLPDRNRQIALLDSRVELAERIDRALEQGSTADLRALILGFVQRVVVSGALTGERRRDPLVEIVPVPDLIDFPNEANGCEPRDRT